MLTIKYTGPILDTSGYGQAARDYCRALLLQGANLTINPLSYSWEFDSLSAARIDDLVPYFRKPLKPDVQVVHTTPDDWLRHHDGSSPLVGMYAWETDRVPTPWRHVLKDKRVTRVIVPSKFNKEITPVDSLHKTYVIPHTLNTAEIVTSTTPLGVTNVSDSSCVIYSIFQWSPRKNPEALLKAYFTAFTPEDDVLLVLKTYGINHTQEETKKIIDQVAAVKSSLKLIHYPKMVLIPTKLNESQILALHRRGSIYVSTHRGEGWGIPSSVALAMGNEVVATDWSGTTEYLNKETGHPISYTLTPVCNQFLSPMYNGDQWWADIDVKSLRDTIQTVAQKASPQEKDAMKQKYMHDNFGYDVVGHQLLELLTETATNANHT